MIKSIRDASLNNKDVLIRVDLNVPFKKGRITDLSRIIAILPTVNYVIKNSGRPILMSHFGRPENKNDKAFSLRQILQDLKNELCKEVTFCEHLDQPSISTFIRNTSKTSIILLENTRFFDGEEKNCPKLSKMLSGLGDLFCNDAFSASHRSHASTVGVAEHLPSYSGLLLEKEVAALNSALSKPEKPVVAVIGGSKISTKITLLQNLVTKVDHIVIGGGMANTFLFAQNKNIGASLYEKKFKSTAKYILEEARKFNCKIHLPVDVVCATGLSPNQKPTLHDATACPENKMILDVGPKTIAKITKVFKTSKTLIWNGPIGVFEVTPFNTATDSIAVVAALLTKEKKLLSIAGGGDTVFALNSSGTSNDFSYISYAGGAFLEWMEGKILPGISALSKY